MLNNSKQSKINRMRKSNWIDWLFYRDEFLELHKQSFDRETMDRFDSLDNNSTDIEIIAMNSTMDSYDSIWLKRENHLEIRFHNIWTKLNIIEFRFLFYRKKKKMKDFTSDMMISMRTEIIDGDWSNGPW